MSISSVGKASLSACTLVGCRGSKHKTPSCRNPNFLFNLFSTFGLIIWDNSISFSCRTRNEKGTRYVCLGSKCAHLWAHISFMQEENAPNKIKKLLKYIRCPEAGKLLSIIADNWRPSIKLMECWLLSESCSGVHYMDSATAYRKGSVWFPQNNLNKDESFVVRVEVVNCILDKDLASVYLAD